MKAVIISLAVLVGLELAFGINDIDCGKRPLYQPESRVLSGSNFTEGDHPWQVALFRASAYNCGGSIIDKYVVLTAAHCISRFLPYY